MLPFWDLSCHPAEPSVTRNIIQKSAEPVQVSAGQTRVVQFLSAMSEKSDTKHTLEQLRGSVSDPALEYFYSQLENSDVIVKKVNSRKSKLGDIKFFRSGKSPVITLNRNLSPDAMTFVMAHEIAHFLDFKKSGKRKNPHGNQWKMTFSKLLAELLELGALSVTYHSHILGFTKNIRAVVSQSSALHSMIFPEHKNISDLIELEQIPHGSIFSIPGHNRFFEKREKRKTRYVCLRSDNSKLYLVSCHQKVSLVK